LPHHDARARQWHISAAPPKLITFAIEHTIA
jgi:hypothetical protein